ncbi:MAG: pyrroline-5-carboxylate reductase [archaeon]|nr:pyrroline-5-carboxylate reductase [archaeon]
MKVSFIGCGKMGSAMAIAVAKTGLHEVYCHDLDYAKSKALEKFGAISHDSPKSAIKNSEIVFFCVKPQALEGTISGLKNSLEGKIVASIAAGKTIASIQRALGKGKIVRVMPNINALASQAASAYACENLSAKEKAMVRELLLCFGTASEFSEKKFDAITALSGSGPAFAAYFIDSLAFAGAQQGLSDKDALELAVQTCLGTSMMLKNGRSAKEISEMVSSPNGTTIAGRKILESGEFRAIISKTIAAAKKRSEELGEEK